jgi:hypothetical protein
MSDSGSSDERRGELALDTADRISKIETDLMKDGNKSVIFLIMLAFLLAIILAGILGYSVGNRNGTTEIRSESSSSAPRRGEG